MAKFKVTIEDSKGTRTETINRRNAESAQDYRVGLKGRVETGATVTVARES